MDRDCIEKSRKCRGESDSAGNKKARLDRRTEMTETEGETKLRKKKSRERDRVRSAVSYEN